MVVDKLQIVWADVKPQHVVAATKTSWQKIT